jgi:hypothetical protein
MIQYDVPLAIVTNIDQTKAIGIQSTRGIVPIEHMDIPPHKPMITDISSTVRSIIKNTDKINSKQAEQMLHDIPTDTIVTIAKGPGTSVFAAVRRSKELKSSNMPTIQNTTYLESFFQDEKNIN